MTDWLTYTRVDPEQPLVLDTLEQLPEVPGCARAGTVGPQVGAEYLHHGVPAGRVGGGTGLAVTVHTAGLLVPLQALPAVVVVPAGVGQAVAGGQVLLLPAPVLRVLSAGRVEDALGPETLVICSVLPAEQNRGEMTSREEETEVFSRMLVRLADISKLLEKYTSSTLQLLVSSYMM